MSTKEPGLKLVKNTWIVRKSVPAELRPVVGKIELLRSLQTDSYAVASKMYPAVWREFEKIIADARSKRVADSPPSYDLQNIDRIFAKWTLAEHAKPLPVSDDLASDWQVQRDLDLYRAAIIEPEAWRSIPRINEDVVAMLASGGIAMMATHPKFAEVRALAIPYRRMLTEKREQERLARAYVRRGASIAVAEVAEAVEAPKALPAPSAVTVQALYQEWVEKVAKPNPKERGRLDHQIRRFIEFFGGDKPVNYIERSEVIDFLMMVPRYPTRRSAELHALPFGEVIERFETEVAKINAANEVRIAKGETPEPIPATLTKSTVELWFSGYQRMFVHAVAKGLVDRNPFDGLRYLIDGADSTKRRAFTDAEIARLFGHASFQSERRGAEFWLPVLSLFHGSRLSELAALPRANFKVTEDGDRYFDLTDQKVKTEGSERLIPLHPRMVEIGFLDYVESLGDAKWLFPDLDHASKHGAGHRPSQDWGRFMDEVGMSDPELTFHSFRHAWKRRARASDVKEEVHDVLSGHASTTVSRKYGDGLDIRDLAKAMAQINFPMFPAITAAGQP